MKVRLILFAILISLLTSCQAIVMRYYGIKNPDIEKEKTVSNAMSKNKIDNAHRLKKDKVSSAYIGSLPKVYVFDKNGYQVMLPNCYEMVEENLYRLVDTIPDALSADSFRDQFVEENIQLTGDGLQEKEKYDFEVYFYWSVWMGKFNIKKLRTAQKTIEQINQSHAQKKIVLIPVNFDFIEEAGWTEPTVNAELRRITEANQKQ